MDIIVGLVLFVSKLGNTRGEKRDGLCGTQMVKGDGGGGDVIMVKKMCKVPFKCVGASNRIQLKITCTN